MADYSKYTEYVGSIVRTRQLSGFRSHPIYQEMLEHVSRELASKYFKGLKTIISIKQIEEFSKKIDSIGSPVMYKLETSTVSGTCVRYLFQAYLILEYMSKLSPYNPATDKIPEFNIVELGAGFGGLCLAINYLKPKFHIKINSYTIYDLIEPLRLQQIFLSMFKIDFPIGFKDGKSIPPFDQSNGFLISNYALSEFDTDTQNDYIDRVVKKTQHGFLTWNTKLIDIGQEVKSEKEYPASARNNLYLHF